jgi:hypothetical protein
MDGIGFLSKRDLLIHIEFMQWFLNRGESPIRRRYLTAFFGEAPVACCKAS